MKNQSEKYTNYLKRNNDMKNQMNQTRTIGQSVATYATDNPLEMFDISPERAMELNAQIQMIPCMNAYGIVLGLRNVKYQSDAELMFCVYAILHAAWKTDLNTLETKGDGTLRGVKQNMDAIAYGIRGAALVTDDIDKIVQITLDTMGVAPKFPRGGVETQNNTPKNEDVTKESEK